MDSIRDGDGSVILEILKLPDGADRFLMLVSSLVLSLIIAMALQGASEPKKFFLVYLLLYALCYYPGTAIALRNVSLTGWPRSVFCFAAIPLFSLALLVSAFIGFSLIPGFASSYPLGSGPRSGQLHGMVIAGIATAMLFGFYKLMQFINARRSGN